MYVETIMSYYLVMIPHHVGIVLCKWLEGVGIWNNWHQWFIGWKDGGDF